MRFLLSCVLFIPVLLMLTVLTRPQPITSDFSEKAPRFYVFASNDKGHQMMLLSEALRSQAGYKFRLDQSSVISNAGDVHEVTVIDSTGDSQTISFNYSNSYMSESVYKVTDNKITPISYQIKASMGMGGLYLLNFLGALVLSSIVSRMVFWLFKKSVNR